jgi:hypothetical protein
MCHWEGGLYICQLSESNGPNLLDELLNGFIWFPLFGPCKPMHLEIMTQSESVHVCAEFNKLVY